MNYIASTVMLFIAMNAAAAGKGLICRDDNRLAGGSLRELILTTTNQGFVMQSHLIPTLNASGQNETWAQDLECRIDDKAPVAFCQNKDREITAMIKDVRESLYDSLDSSAKKKSVRRIDISVVEGNITKQVAHFAANQCHVLESEMSVG